MGRAGGRVGIAVVGGIIGNAIAPGVGGSIGWLVGSLIGALVLPDNVNQRGPRIGDLMVTTSAYGSPIPRGFGTVRVGGNITWVNADQVTEIKTSRSQGKGGGVKITSYDYFGSFAIDFGEGVAADVLRIWADNKIIFDKRSASDNVTKAGLVFRFYQGTEDQLPDPLEVADKGEFLVPGYRGHVRLLFDNLPLADFGNRLPQINAEIAYTSVESLPVTEATEQSGATLTSANNTFFAADLQRGYAYAIDSAPVQPDASAPTLTGLRRVNLHTMVEDRQITSADSLAQISETTFAAKPGCVLPLSGRIALQIDNLDGGGTNSNPIVLLDQVSLREIGRNGLSGSSVTMGPNDWGPIETMDAIGFIGPLGPEEFVLVGGSFGSFGVGAALQTGEFNYVWDNETFLTTTSGDRVKGLVHGKTTEGQAEAWVVMGNQYGTPSSDSLHLYRIKIKAGSVYSLLGSQSVNTGVDVDLVKSWTPGELVSGETSLTNAGTGLVYDEVDNSIIFHVKGVIDTTDSLIKVDVEDLNNVDDGIVWRYENSGTPNPGDTWNQSRLQNDSFGYFLADRGRLIDTRTGKELQDDTWSVNTPTGSRGVYDSRRDAWVGLTSTTSIWAKWYFRRRTGLPANLEDIVSTLMTATQLVAADIDVTALAGLTVPGYIVSSVASARDAIQPLSTVFLFDIVESDFKLKAVLRGGASVRTLTQDELGSPDGSTNKEFFPETRIQETDLPRRLIINYMDQENDYQQGTQSAKRIQDPTPTMFSLDEATVEIAAVLQATFAKQYTEKALFTAWIERSTFATMLDWSNLDLDPADVITVTLDDGDTFRCRLVSTDVGVGFPIDTTLIAEETNQYVSDATADNGDGPILQKVPATIETKLIVMDAPLLQDQDEPSGRGFIQMYFAMGGFGQPGWTSGTIHKSSDGSLYDQVGRSTSEVTWGSAVNALGDPPSANPFQTDETNTLIVALSTDQGTLESVTNLEMLNGANGAMLIQFNGEVEVFQFQNATNNGDGTFTLDTLLRGRRGTDTMSFDHAAGETFILLTPADLDRFSIALGEQNIQRFYRGVGQNQDFGDAFVVTNTSVGRALMPYAPVQVAATLEVADDVEITWERRTRVGGALIDGAGTVPLSEDTEEYEIDIFLTSGATTPVRTVTGLTTALYLYAEADQTSDGFTTPISEITVEVYQISAQVGRGFVRRATVPVE